MSVTYPSMAINIQQVWGPIGCRDALELPKLLVQCSRDLIEMHCHKIAFHLIRLISSRQAIFGPFFGPRSILEKVYRAVLAQGATTTKQPACKHSNFYLFLTILTFFPKIDLGPHLKLPETGVVTSRGLHETTPYESRFFVPPSKLSAYSGRCFSAHSYYPDQRH